jgi:hypothetical protein
MARTECISIAALAMGWTMSCGGATDDLVFVEAPAPRPDTKNPSDRYQARLATVLVAGHGMAPSATGPRA